MPAKRRVIRVKDRLPPTGQWVIAVTAKFRCMAYVDSHGKWRDVNRGQQIENVESWSPLNQTE